MNAVIKTETVVGQAEYICRRVVDALLRENVRDCISQAHVLEGNELPFAQQLPPRLADGQWLLVVHLGQLYIPVEQSDFMQPWRLRSLPLVQMQNGQLHYHHEIDSILACFELDLSEADKKEFSCFVGECHVATSHGVRCEQERERLFQRSQTYVESEGNDWAKRLLHYERLASFLDHPFYPTARAKLGFSSADLTIYAPEFGATFKLRWLAVPQILYQGTFTALPAWWPSFNDVGLPASLADSHYLLPVHPFMWEHHLQGLLVEASLFKQVELAPKPFLKVAATLSVRTVIVQQAPEWHLKLPLSIRTLGAKNIRTIKPSTVKDGHTVQSMLAAIAAVEPNITELLLLTDESRGAEVAGKNFLGFILRHYPQVVEETVLVPVAALLAETANGQSVFEELAQEFYGGSVMDFFEEYVTLTLRLHLTLWIRYGIALESNQQNSVLVLSQDNDSQERPRLRLLLKDNDSGRILPEQLIKRCPELVPSVASLQDRRILVTEQLPLAQMFTTITLQLNIAVLIEGLAKQAGLERKLLYMYVRNQIENLLGELHAEGEDISLAQQVLLEDKSHYIKYLLRAASLENKQSTGASDVNKFYGKSAPNMLWTV